MHMHDLGASGKLWDRARRRRARVPARDPGVELPLAAGVRVRRSAGCSTPAYKVGPERRWDNTPAHEPILDTRWGVRSTDEMCIGSLYTTGE
ncbi:MAG TPA: hypothetical protein VHB21_27800 [Minicystis sp.]|nr:hypothetical protein [Minicystis sp.]